MVTTGKENITLTCVTSPGLTQVWQINGSYLKDIDPHSLFTYSYSEPNGAGQSIYNLLIRQENIEMGLTSVTCLADECGNETA